MGAGAAAACPEVERRKMILGLQYSTQKEATIYPFLALRLTTESPTACKPAYDEMLKTPEKFNSSEHGEALSAMAPRSPRCDSCVRCPGGSGFM